MATYPHTAGDLAVDLDSFPGVIAWRGVDADRWKPVPADEHAEASNHTLGGRWRAEGFVVDGDRYRFDFALSADAGWAQLDTFSDASYYGHWTSARRLAIAAYVEGDVSVTVADSGADYLDMLRRFEAWCAEQTDRRFRNGRAAQIDPGFSTDLRDTFVEIGAVALLPPPIEGDSAEGIDATVAHLAEQGKGF